MHCPNCGSELKIIAAVLKQPVIGEIVSHLALQARAPPRLSLSRPSSSQAVSLSNMPVAGATGSAGVGCNA